MSRTLHRILLVLLGSSSLALAARPFRAPQAAPRAAEVLAVAKPYLATYARFDLEGLRPFLDEASVWCDPTTAELGLPGAPVQGVEAILTELRNSTAGVQDLHFEFTETFASGGRVIAIGTLFYTLPPQALGRTERPAHFELRVVSALHIEGGKVRSHTDYTDFSRWHETAR